MFNEREKPVWKYVMLAVILAIIAALICGVVYVFQDAFGLPTLALGGVLVLLASLLVFTTLMNVIGLSDKTQALGLPEGSVRAIIALALVGLFAILASSFLQSTSEERQSLSGRSQEEVNAFNTNNKDARNVFVIPEAKKNVGDAATYVITYTLPALSADDFSKQMMTLVGTLMTAVVSFYFGAMPKTPSDISRAAPEVSGIENPTRPVATGSLNLTATGSNLNSIRSVRLTKGAIELEGASILSNASQVSCTFPFATEMSVPGTWDLTVVDDIGRSAPKKNALTFIAAAPTGISPNDAKAVPTEFKIAGSGLGGVTKVEAVSSTGSTVAATEVKSAGDHVTCKMTLSPGTWSVHLTTSTASGIAVPGQIVVS